MAKFKFFDVEMAFDYVSSTQECMNSALLCLDTGEIYWASDMAGTDDIEEADENGLIDWDQTAYMPHKNDMDLGRELVFDFIEKFMPNDYGKVRDIFRGRGAYRRYKDFLERKGKLQLWFDYESTRNKQALVEWCVEKNVELEDAPAIGDILSDDAVPASIPCDISYVEFPSKDLEATKKFFSDVFGWVFTDFGNEYTSFAEQGIKGGFYQADTTCSTANGNALVVLYTQQLQRVHELIEKSGGSIVKPIFEFPGGKRFHFTDPTGNEYAVWSDVS